MDEVFLLESVMTKRCIKDGCNGEMLLQSETATSQYWVCSKPECRNRVTMPNEEWDTMKVVGSVVMVGVAIIGLFFGISTK